MTFVEGNVLSKYAKFQLHPPDGFREEDFFFENLLFMSVPIKLSDFDKNRTKHGVLLNKHFCKMYFFFFQISPMIQQKLSISTFPL